MRQPRLEELSGLSRLHFDSFTQAIRFADAHKGASSAACRTENQGNSYKFSHTANFGEAFKLAAGGWKDGRNQIKTFRGRVSGLISSAHQACQEINFQVIGNGGLDMGRVMTGEPESFMEWEDTDRVSGQVGQKVITIFNNSSTSAGVSGEVIMRRGAVLLSMIDVLEASGYSVELWDCSRASGGWGGSGHYELLIPIKTAGQTVQEDQIVFACAHPSWLRRIQFSIICQCGIHGGNAAGKSRGGNGSYGSPEDYEPEELERMKADIYLPRMHAYEAQWQSDDKAIAWLCQQVKVYGVELDPAKAGVK